jgi:hypothetical protein
MAKRYSEREVETDLLRRKFERSGAGKRYSTYSKKRRPWASSRNTLARLLMDAYVNTHEPAFIQAFMTLAAYGCDGDANPARRLKALGTLIANADAALAVEEELQQQAKTGERRSLRKAWDCVAARGIEAPSFEAARKRVERAFTAHRDGLIPNGDSGRKMLVAKIERCSDCNTASLFEVSRPSGSLATAVIVEKITWVPDDRLTRQVIFADQDFVILDTRSPENKCDRASVDDDDFKSSPAPSGSPRA